MLINYAFFWGGILTLNHSFFNNESRWVRSSIAEKPLDILTSLKMYSDNTLKLSYFVPIPRPRYKWYSPTQKQCISDGVLFDFTFDDIRKKELCDSISLSRTRRYLEDISNNNKFAYFLTVTLNEKYVRRSDCQDVRRVFKAIIRRLKYKYGGFSYVQVAEFHDDLQNIHFHLLCNSFAPFKLHRFGRTIGGHIMYHFKKGEIKYDDCFFGC